MLGTLGLPFPRNTWPKIGPCIIHGHYLNRFGMRKVVVMWRDGRDVMVSWYHHCLYLNERGNLRLVRRTHQALAFNAPDDVRSNLPIFIEYCFIRQDHPEFTWADFVRVWHEQRNVVNAFYEALRKDTSAELGRIIRELTGVEIPKEHIDRVVTEFSFERQSGRKIGVENKQSFMRKGIVGDWENVFSPEAREIFAHYAGQELIALGYEQDHSWAHT